MKRAILLLILLPTATANLWLPFANFGTMFGAIREAAFGSRDSETMATAHSNPLTYFAMAGKELLHNLQKIFLGDEEEEGKNTDEYEIPESFRELPTEVPEETTTADNFPISYTFGPPTTEEVPVVPRTYLPGFKFTFPYTTPYWMSTTKLPTLGPIKARVWTKAITTTTTTATTTEPFIFPEEETTMRPVPITWTPFPLPESTVSEEVHTELATTTTTPSTTTTQFLRIPWKTPEFTTLTTTLSVRERMTRPNIRKVTPTPSSRPIYPTTIKDKDGSTCEICKPGRQCRVKLRSFETADPLFQYAYSHSTMIDDNMQALLRETQMFYFPPPLSWKNSASPEVVQLTQTFMSAFRPSRCLIAGIFTGLAVIGIGSHVDTRGIIVALEYPEMVQYWDKIGMRHAQKLNLMSRIQVRSADTIDRSLQKLAANEPNTFDLIFLDDYRKQNYLDDYEHVIKLARPGGLVIINEALNGGSVMSPPEMMTADAKSVRNMNIRIKQDTRVRATLLPFSGGTWVITKI